ncbi:unnamed protein product [Meganyctiphanes norvegica]|uniref:Uncharacterized protein n=1 Tax=Meganyctiphanes norvegica TaxID=48144 RepID=A0AAV2PZ32_MEGNR
MAWVWSLFLSVTTLGLVSAQGSFCGGQGNLKIGQTAYFTSPQYPYPYPGGLACRWIANTPPGTTLALNCAFDVDATDNCKRDQFYVSPSGDLTKDWKYFCGTGNLKFETNTNKFDAYFATTWPSFNYQHKGFFCSLKVVSGTTPTEPPAPPPVECKCGKKVNGHRIVGGQVSNLHEWRWQAALRLRKDNLQVCGATLIADQWLVTAAHCVTIFKKSDLYVSLGEHDKNTGSDTTATRHVDIRRVIIHSQYDSKTNEHDIALLELDSYTSNSNIHPVCLPTKHKDSTFAGTTGTATGWGSTSWNGPDSSHLQEVELPIITNNKCSSDLDDYAGITGNMICTYAVGKDACQGDSGGPLVWKSPSGHYMLVGIVSFGYRCAETGYPGVYTRVTKYLPWIQGNTGLSFCEA